MTAVMPVLIGPGQTQFAVTPLGPSSTASERVRPITPCLAAVYAGMPAVAPSPSVDATLTIRPRPSRRRSSSAARTKPVYAVRLMASVVLHARSKSSESISAGTLTPALLTRPSTGPSAERISPTARAGAPGSATSALTAWTAAPAPAISPATRASPSASRSTMPTAAPSSASRWAVARPMPLAAPVTITTFPATERLSVVRRGMRSQVGLLHARARVHADDAQRALTGVLEAVDRLGRHDDDVARRDVEPLVAGRERGDARLHDERLRVRVVVQVRALPALRVVGDEDRDGDLVAALEQRSGRAAAQLLDRRDGRAHVPGSVAAATHVRPRGPTARAVTWSAPGRSLRRRSTSNWPAWVRTAPR